MNNKIKKSIFLIVLTSVILLSTGTLSAVKNTNIEKKDIENNSNIENNNINIKNYKIDKKKNTTATKLKTSTNKNTTYNSNPKNTKRSISKKDQTNNSANVKKSGIMDIPLNKSRKIYFAMDHTNRKDKTICNNVVKTLKNAGFNVVKYSIGPNAMYSNMKYLYNHKIKNAIMFHLFNGVDPSNIREVAVNGNDNRGRIVRQRGNDVVLAWFYDASDCVHPGGNAYYSVRGSETGPRLYNPKQYMDKNKIYYLCTSSDKKRHKTTADYTGIKTANEFIKLFNIETQTKVTNTTLNNATLTITGTVTSKYANNICGNITIKDSNNKIINNNVTVKNGAFTTSITVKKAGIETYKINYNTNKLNKASNTTKTVNIPKNTTIIIKQKGNTVSNTKLEITLLDDKTNKIEANRTFFIKFSNTTLALKTNKNGKAFIKINNTKSESVLVYVTNGSKTINSEKYNITIKKNNVTVTASNITAVFQDKIRLKAIVKDANNKSVNCGKVIFIINNRYLSKDKSFNSSLEALEVNVVRGIAIVDITADSHLYKENNLTATYLGNYKYNSNQSESSVIRLTNNTIKN